MDVGKATVTQYLTFILDHEEYAVEVVKVKEVLEMVQVTRVPKTREYMKGVINLRGSVVPVVDLRMKLAMGETEKSVDTCIIVLELDIDGETVTIGALADAVQEVIDLGSDNVEPSPKLGTAVDTEFIAGMGKRDENFIIILDIDRVFTYDDREEVKAAVSSGKRNLTADKKKETVEESSE
ncbi:MAG: chemotaxis protein CheW [Spirochaetia bacterium]